MLEPPRISPLPASARSCCAAARPLPRSSRVKHLDCDTNTLISASGDSRLYASHHLFSGSVTASVPMRLSQRSEEHTSELQSHLNLVCRLLLEKKKKHDILN